MGHYECKVCGQYYSDCSCGALGRGLGQPLERLRGVDHGVLQEVVGPRGRGEEQAAPGVEPPAKVHAITALVYVTPDRRLVPILASEGADPSWSHFLRVPGELPEKGGLWLMGALWSSRHKRYELLSWSRPSLAALAAMEAGTWTPPPSLPVR